MIVQKNLSLFHEGEEGKIVFITNDFMASKLLTMGLLPGKSIKLVRKAPFGGGYYLKVQNHNIAVREEEAREIMIETNDGK